MKTIIYLSIFLVASINSCKQKNQNETTTANNTEIISIASTPDTTGQAIDVKDTTRTKSQMEDKNKIIKERQIEYFKLLNATTENWTAGIASGGSGTDYYFKIKITTSEKITFDTTWLNNKAFEIFISKEANSVSNEPAKYSNGEIITLRVSDLKNQNMKPTNVVPPLKYNGAALIGYKVNGKQKYFIIKEIKKQNSPNRP